MLTYKEKKNKRTKFTIYSSERIPAKGLNFLVKMKKKDLEKREGAKRSRDFYKSCKHVIL